MPSAVLKLYELAHEPPDERRRKLPFASRRPRFIHMPLIRNPANRHGAAWPRLHYGRHSDEIALLTPVP